MSAVRCAVVVAVLCSVCSARADFDHKVVWTSPSQDMHGSMPAGNGDLAANVWVEPDGDLVFYLSKTDAWSENGRLLKLGRVRVTCEPALFEPGARFTQTLDPKSGVISIQTVTGGRNAELSFWIDANHPVVRVEGQFDQPTIITAQLELWRTVRREIANRELFSAYGVKGQGTPVWAEPDTVVTSRTDRVVWYHRNERSIWEQNLTLQALDDSVSEGRDPLLHRTFGALMRGNGLVAKDSHTLVSGQPAQNFVLSVHALTTIADTAEDWTRQLNEQREVVDATPMGKARVRHVAWWSSFWDRSWIHVETVGASGAAAILPPNEHAFHIGRDPQGNNRFVGKIGRVSILAKALSDEAVTALAARPRDQALPEDPDLRHSGPAAVGSVLKGSAAWTFPGGLTVETWIRPGALPAGGGRILDKCTPATRLGFVLDTCPGNSLRAITGGGTLTVPKVLPRDKWVHVAAVVDTAASQVRLFLDGRRVGELDLAVSDDASIVSQAYALQRYVQACAGRGAFPIKFNGSLFTVDANDKGRWDADYRRWGGGYWWQNTRLIYWNMLASGDLDLMEPLFRLYRNALPIRQQATRIYYQHDGAFFPETMWFWGAYIGDNYGWNREGKPVGLTDNLYVRRYWQSGLELTAMMLDRYHMTGDKAFLDEMLLPIAENVVLFYDQHWQRDDDGKIIFHPAQSLETWWDSRNPLPVVAGLRYILGRMVELPVEEQKVKEWERVLGALPAIPMRNVKGKDCMAPGDTWKNKKNMENPELYAVFPYKLFTVLQDEAKLQLGRNTFAVRGHPEVKGWQQDPIQAALLGLADEAKRMVIRNFKTRDHGGRFPGFWGPNYDWIPDQDQPSVTMTALQGMLMQYDDRKILLLPAWPKDWNCSFKLHAPQQTTIEGRIEDGVLLDLDVTPASRREDIVVHPDWSRLQK